jgi:hypothetical protein
MCLYSAASIFLRSLSAVFQSFCSKVSVLFDLAFFSDIEVIGISQGKSFDPRAVNGERNKENYYILSDILIPKNLLNISLLP